MNEVVETPYALTFMGPRKPPSEGNDSSKPNYVTDSTKRMLNWSKRSRHLMEGFDCILANCDTYLPRVRNEDAEDYEFRKAYAVLRNYFAQAITTMIGKVFAQPPRLKPDVPAVIQQDLEDADFSGNHWTMLAEDYFKSAIVEGLSWLIVDFPPVPEDVVGNLTLGEEKRLGLRPYWFTVPQSRVLGIKFKKQGEISRLTQFRYAEWVEEETGEFGSQLVEYIYCYEPDRIRAWRKGDDGNWVGVRDAVNTLGAIPAVPLNLNRVARFEAKAPMDNLAQMNIEHFQIRSDQRRSLSVSSFPILVTSGVEAADGQRTRIGPFTSIMLEDPHASVKWVEMQGTATQQGAKELEKLESDIRTFGLSFSDPQMYATATGRNIDASDAIAPIQLWAHRLRDALEMALHYHARWRKLSEGGSIDINTAFLRSMLTVEEIKLLIEALKEGAITPRALLQRLKDYGLLAEDFDVDKDVAEALAIADKAQKDLIATKAATEPTTPPANGGTNDAPEPE